MENILRDFLWEGSQLNGGMHNINLRKTVKSFALGSLGVDNISQRNSALLAKWIGIILNFSLVILEIHLLEIHQTDKNNLT